MRTEMHVNIRHNVMHHSIWYMNIRCNGDCIKLVWFGVEERKLPCVAGGICETCPMHVHSFQIYMRHRRGTRIAAASNRKSVMTRRKGKKYWFVEEVRLTVMHMRHTITNESMQMIAHSLRNYYRQCPQYQSRWDFSKLKLSKINSSKRMRPKTLSLSLIAAHLAPQIKIFPWKINK